MPPLFPLLLALNACDDGADKTLTVRHDSATTTDGWATFEVKVPDSTRSFLVSGFSEGLTSVYSLESPGGERVFFAQDWWYADRLLTMATFPVDDEVVLNWPVRAEDGPLHKGTWLLTLDTYQASGRPLSDGSEVDLTVYFNADENVRSGTLEARIVYAQGLRDDDDLVAGVQDAVRVWKQVYRDAGITLEVSYDTSDVDPYLSSTSTGSEAYRDITAESSNQEITVLLGTHIEGSGSTFEVLGEAGDIPGNLEHTDTALVGVALADHAGNDGVIDEDEAQLLGSTMAHEVGHYLGLFHPVEGTFDWWDALEDTPECTSMNACEDLTTNLMYYSATCSWTECTFQSELTDDQVGVLQRYTGLQ